MFVIWGRSSVNNVNRKWKRKSISFEKNSQVIKSQEHEQKLWRKLTCTVGSWELSVSENLVHKWIFSWKWWFTSYTTCRNSLENVPSVWPLLCYWRQAMAKVFLTLLLLLLPNHTGTFGNMSPILWKKVILMQQQNTSTTLKRGREQRRGNVWLLQCPGNQNILPKRYLFQLFLKGPIASLCMWWGASTMNMFVFLTMG